MNGANGMSDIEGNVLRERVTKLCSEGISIMKDEIKAMAGAACRGLSFSR